MVALRLVGAAGTLLVSLTSEPSSISWEYSLNAWLYTDESIYLSCNAVAIVGTSPSSTISKLVDTTSNSLFV